MKNFILMTVIFISQICLSTVQAADTCEAGKYFDTSLNRCVLSTKTVENKTEALNCQGLTGEAAQSCFKNIVDGEVSEMEASGKVESAKNPKANYIIPAIVTLGSAFYLFKRSDSLKSCGSISVYLMLGGGVTTILGEFLAQRKYKGKLKKMEKNYSERTSENKDAKDNDDLETINANQTIAFDYQIEQERARESAHKMRKTVYTLATGLYAGATAAAIYEAATLGLTAAKCKTEENAEGAEDTAAEDAVESTDGTDEPSSGGSNAPGRFDPNPTSFIQSEDSLNISIAALTNPKVFGEYTYLEKITSDEFREIILRKLVNIVFPSAHAQDADTAAVAPAPTEGGGVVGAARGAASVVGKTMGNLAASPVFRAALSGILTIYSKKIASKAKKLAKEAAARAEAIEELRDNFLANGGAGFANCTESERTKVSKPMCYCYQADGSRNPSRAQSPTCIATYGKTGGTLTAASNYDLNGTGMPLSAKACLSNSGQADESCACKKTNSCTTISGSLNLGSLSNIDGLSRTVSDAANFSSGNISAGNLDDGTLERAIANIETQTEGMLDKPNVKPIRKKINDLGFRIEKSFGNSIQNAANRGAISPELASFSTGGLNGADNSDQATVAALSPGSTTSSSPERVNLSGGGSAGVSIDDFDFNSKSSGGVKLQDENAQIMAREFKVDDINDNSAASIFSIISNRYQTTGLRTLFSEDEEVNEN